MALTTTTAIKASWLNVSGTEHDARLQVMIDDVAGRANAICNQPIDGTAYIHYVDGRSTGSLMLLPFTVPVVLTTAEVKEELSDTAFTTITDVSIVKRNALWWAYREDGWGEYDLVKLTLAIGYDGSTYTVPNDLRNLVSEWVASEFRMTDYGGDATRLGVLSQGRSEGGGSSTTTYENMDAKFKRRLRPYTRVLP